MSIFDSDQPLLFDASKERIKRQTSAIVPIRVMYPETQKERIAGEIADGRRKVFESDGILGLIESSEDAAYVARVMAKLKYGSTHLLFNDLASGLYSAYTRKEVFAEEPRRLIDEQTGKVVKTSFTISHEALYKLMLGPVVNENGRAITGAGPVVKQLKSEIEPIIRGEEVEPIACASINVPARNGQGEEIAAAVFGKPIIIDKWTTKAVRILLDHSFFPIFESNGRASTKYLNTVAGLSATLGFGRYLLRQKGQSGFPQTMDAHRLILSLQAAFEMDTFASGAGLIRENSLGRQNVTFRRSAIKNLRPEAVSSEGRISFGSFIDFVNQTGRMYRAALDETGIIDQLPDSILIPATDHGAEFPSDPRIVFVKVDKKR